jgi:hypothetical protein
MTPVSAVMKQNLVSDEELRRDWDTLDLAYQTLTADEADKCSELYRRTAEGLAEVVEGLRGDRDFLRKLEENVMHMDERREREEMVAVLDSTRREQSRAHDAHGGGRPVTAPHGLGGPPRSPRSSPRRPSPRSARSRGDGRRGPVPVSPAPLSPLRIMEDRRSHSRAAGSTEGGAAVHRSPSAAAHIASTPSRASTALPRIRGAGAMTPPPDNRGATVSTPTPFATPRLVGASPSSSSSPAPRVTIGPTMSFSDAWIAPDPATAAAASSSAAAVAGLYDRRSGGGGYGSGGVESGASTSPTAVKRPVVLFKTINMTPTSILEVQAAWDEIDNAPQTLERAPVERSVDFSFCGKVFFFFLNSLILVLNHGQ